MAHKLMKQAVLNGLDLRAGLRTGLRTGLSKGLSKGLYLGLGMGLLIGQPSWAVSAADLAKINEAVSSELTKSQAVSLRAVAQAGHLRTLSGSISTHVTMVARGNEADTNRIVVGKAALAFEDGLKALIFGDSELGLSPIEELDVLNHMQAVSERWGHLRERLIAVLSGSSVDDSLLQQVTALATDLGHATDAAVSMLVAKVPGESRAKAPLVNMASGQMMLVHAMLNEWLLGYDFEPVIDAFEVAQLDIASQSGADMAANLNQIDQLWQRFKMQLNVKSINPAGRMDVLNSRATELLEQYEKFIAKLIA